MPASKIFYYVECIYGVRAATETLMRRQTQHKQKSFVSFFKKEILPAYPTPDAILCESP
jgi:hypothetical protein